MERLEESFLRSRASRFGAAGWRTAGTGVLIGALLLAQAASSAAGEAKPGKVAPPKSGAAVAGSAPAVAPDPVAAQRAELQLLAHKMMGHVNLSALALDSGLPEAAAEHVATARKLASELERQVPQSTTDTTLRYGKLTYRFEDVEKDYYVPILDDVFLLSDYRQTFRAFRETDLEETEAGVVRVTLRADLRKVEHALDETAARIAARHPREAAESLRSIFRDALVEEEIVTDPTWAIYDNLALARNLVAEHHFKGARLVLSHAQKRLDELEKRSFEAASKGAYHDMHAQIEALSKKLEREDPTLLESADRSIHDWMAKVRSWAPVPK
ncbi:MAG: YfdX family protein [Myxococcota bacterium]